MITKRQIWGVAATAMIAVGVTSVALDDGIQGCVAIGDKDDVFMATDEGTFESRNGWNTDGDECYTSGRFNDRYDRIDEKIYANPDAFDFTNAPKVKEAFTYVEIGPSGYNDRPSSISSDEVMHNHEREVTGYIVDGDTIIHIHDPDNALGPAQQIFGGQPQPE